MSKKNGYDSAYQPELQWIEDGIHILFDQIVQLFFSIVLILCLIARGVWKTALRLVA